MFYSSSDIAIISLLTGAWIDCGSYSPLGPFANLPEFSLLKISVRNDV